MVITQAAADETSVRALVYVNAFAPETGESALSLFGQFPGSTLADKLVQYPVSTGGNEVAMPRRSSRRSAGREPQCGRRSGCRRSRCQ
jgi:hypothetical protein